MGFKLESIGLMLVLSVLLVIQTSTCGPLENEKLVALSERLEKLQTKVESLETENEALKRRVDYLEKKDTKNEAKIRGQGEEIIQLKIKMDAKLMESIQYTGPSHDALVNDIRPSHDNKMNSIYRKVGPSDDTSTRAVVPSSCRELSMIGHILDGLYLVQNPDTKKVETVFCTFGITSISEALIGQVEVKTKTVHFYVQRISSFDTSNAVIPFELARLNEGDAFNLPSGIFTVPVPGIYHFDFSAVKGYTAPYLEIYLQVNGANVGRSDTATSQTPTGNYDVAALSASLRLAVGDRVNVANWGIGTLWDDNYHRTHFSGWLVEEELM